MSESQGNNVAKRKEKIIKCALLDIVEKRLTNGQYIPDEIMKKLLKETDMISVSHFEMNPCKVEFKEKEENEFKKDFHEALVQKCQYIIQESKKDVKSNVDNFKDLFEHYSEYNKARIQFKNIMEESIEVLNQLIQIKINNLKLSDELSVLYETEYHYISQKIDFIIKNALYKMHSERKHVTAAHKELHSVLKTNLREYETELITLKKKKELYESAQQSEEYKSLLDKYLKVMRDIDLWTEICKIGKY